MRYLVLSSALALSTVLSGCFLMGAQSKVSSLKDIQISTELMPKVCTLRKPPGKGFPCPFNEVPYYSKDPKFIGCMQKLLGGVVKGFEMDEVRLEAFLEKPQSRDLGMFAFRLKNQSDVKAFQEHLETLEPMLKKERSREDVLQQGRMVLYFWNDIRKDPVCLPAYKKQVFKQLGMQSQ